MHRPPAPVLRYIDEVVAATSCIEYRYSLSVLTDFDVDVVHVSDTNLDSLLGTRGGNGMQRVLSAAALTRNLKRHDIALVRTLDIDGPAGGRAGLTQLAFQVLDRATDAFITFDEAAPTPDPGRTITIPHPHLRERFVGYPSGRSVPGRVLSLGTPYLTPASLTLLAMPHLLEEPDAHVRLAGELAEGETTLGTATSAGRVHIRRERLSDAATIMEIDQAEIVVVPTEPSSYEELRIVFMALSRDRSLLTLHTPAMARLSEAVGPGWLHLADGAISAEAIDATLASVRQRHRTPRSNLSGRSLSATQGAYEDVFRRVAFERALRRQH